MPTKKQQQLTLFDDMPGSPLFSSIPITAKNGGAFKPQSQRQQRLPATCHFCGDTGRTADGLCWCEAGQRARSKADKPAIQGPMKRPEFDRILKQCSRKNGLLSKTKIRALDNATKNRMISTIVRKRQPIIVDLLNDDTDMAWLHSCAYFHRVKGTHFEFLCTAENKHQV